VLRDLGSAIALAPSGKDDGLLTAEEILNARNVTHKPSHSSQSTYGNILQVFNQNFVVLGA
jgi:hypothetical protein